jgi:hypothetical protein
VQRLQQEGEVASVGCRGLSYSAFDANWQSSCNLAVVVEDSVLDEYLDDFSSLLIEDTLNV